MNYCRGASSEGYNGTLGRSLACNAAAQLLIEKGYGVTKCPYLTVLGNEALSAQMVTQAEAASVAPTTGGIQ